MVQVLDGFGNAVTTRPDTLFVHHRECPREWRDALARVCPPYDGATTFDIVWEPGEEWEPIQRWMIVQELPVAMTRKLILEDSPLVMGLTDPHPREDAHWDDTTKCFRKSDGRLAKTDKFTWEHYQRTGKKATRFWVVQGETGGHRYNLSALERKVLAAGTQGKILDVPLAGDQPYAPVDGRVLRHFEKIEAAATARKIYKYAEQNWARLDREERDEAEFARAYLLDWLGEQFGQQFETYKPQIKAALRKVKERTPPWARRETTDPDEARAQFIAG